MNNNILMGTSNTFTVLGQVQGTDDDYKLIANYIGKDVTPDDIAIVEAVAFDSTKNSNGWQVADLQNIDTIGAGLTYDHSFSAKDNHGYIFAERTDGIKKIVKIAIDKKAPKNADILSDLQFKPFTSPAIKVGEWKDKEKQIVGTGRLTHLSIVTDPAYGESNKVLSLAAEKQSDQDLFASLGKKIHDDNVIAAVRFSERKQGGFTPDQRVEAENRYKSMSPLTLNNEILPMLKELVTAQNNTNSQKTVSAITDNSTVVSIRNKPAYPFYSSNKTNNNTNMENKL